MRVYIHTYMYMYIFIYDTQWRILECQLSQKYNIQFHFCRISFIAFLLEIHKAQLSFEIRPTSVTSINTEQELRTDINLSVSVHSLEMIRRENWIQTLKASIRNSLMNTLGTSSPSPRNLQISRYLLFDVRVQLRRQSVACLSSCMRLERNEATDRLHGYSGTTESNAINNSRLHEVQSLIKLSLQH